MVQVKLSDEDIAKITGKGPKPKSEKASDASEKVGRTAAKYAGQYFDMYVQAVAAPFTKATFIHEGIFKATVWGERLEKVKPNAIIGSKSLTSLYGKAGNIPYFGRIASLGGGRIIPVIGAAFALFGCFKSIKKACKSGDSGDVIKASIVTGCTAIGFVLGWFGGPLGAMVGMGLGKLVGDLLSSKIVTGFMKGLYEEGKDAIIEAKNGFIEKQLAQA